MKKLFSLIAVLFIMGTAVYASVEPSTSVGVAIVRSGETFKVFYKGLSKSDVSIIIKNQNDQVVYSETHRKTDGFSRPYNFSGLPEGEYSFEVTTATGREVNKINYSNSALETFAQLIKIANEDDKYLLTMFNLNSDIVTINVLDANKKIIHSSTEEVSKQFAKVYNMKKLNGKFSVEVVSDKGKVKTLNY
jgi:hypothetical protein